MFYIFELACFRNDFHSLKKWYIEFSRIASMILISTDNIHFLMKKKILIYS